MNDLVDQHRIFLHIQEDMRMKSGVAESKAHSTSGSSRWSTSRRNSDILIDHFTKYCEAFVKLAILVCIVNMLQGCFPLWGKVEIKGDNEQQLLGVWDSLKNSSDVQPVRMLYIHGMGIYTDMEFAQTFANSLTEKLNLTKGGCEEEIPLQNNLETSPGGQLPQAKLSICTYADSQRRTLQLYAVRWSPLTEGIKKAVLSYDSAENYEDDRVKYNREMKKEVMNESLSDPLLYLSPHYQDDLQLVMQQAICFIASRNDSCETVKPTMGVQQNNRGLFIITESLGSTMLYDTLKKIYRDGDSLKAAGEKLIRDSVVHYMFANQLPLLCLGRYDPAPGDKGRDCITNTGTKAAQQDKPLTIVAFSDPNDLLSYPLKKEQFQELAISNPVAVTNVLLNVEKWTLLYVFVHPHDAHTGHRKNADVLQIIACGIDNKKPKECKPAPTRAGMF